MLRLFLFTCFILQLFVGKSQNDHNLILQAIKKDSLKDYQGAMKDLDLVLSHHDNDTARTLHGKIYLEMNDPSHAMGDLNKVIQHTHNYPDAYFIRGLIKAKVKNYEGAVHDFSKAIKLKPNFNHAYYDRGLAYAYLENFKKADEDFTRAIEMDSTYAKAWFNRGYWRDVSGRTLDAIPDFNKALELDPQNPEIHLEMAEAYYSVKKITEACASLHNAIKYGAAIDAELKKSICNEK